MVLNVLTAYLTILKHIVLIVENVCNPKSHPKGECSRCSFLLHLKMFVIHTKLSPISLLFCNLMIDFFLTYIVLPNVSVLSSNYFFHSQILFLFLVPSVSHIHLNFFVFSSDLRDLGKSFPFNFSCLALPFQ